MNDLELPECTSLSDILRLQDSMIAAGCKPNETGDICAVTHHFAPGMYGRSMTIPAGVVVVGKMHRHEHLTVVLKGRIRVATESGNREVVGPCVFVSPAGVKRVGYALEDTEWITFHAAETTDLKELEDILIVPESEVLEMANRQKELQ